MSKRVWKTSLAIVAFFAVMALVYYLSATDVWKNEPSPLTTDDGQANDTSVGEGQEDNAVPAGDGTGGDEGGNGEEDAETDADSLVQQGEPTEHLLEMGDSGSAVRKLQEQLKELGYDLDVDGEYGMITRWYVKDVQQQSGLSGDGSYDTATEDALKKTLNGELTLEPGQGIHLRLPDRVVTNPEDLLALVNKTRALPDDYVPEELVEPAVPLYFQGENLPHNKMRRVAAEALEALFQRAEQEGLALVARSGYRSFETQKAVFARNEERKGTELANQYSARAGESEHQTGLVMDVTSPAVNHELVTEFVVTKEGQWLEDHAADFGFIIRYPQGKEDVTGYQFEPWHLRYVGKEAAKEIAAEDLTLEEYLLRK